MAIYVVVRWLRQYSIELSRITQHKMIMLLIQLLIGFHAGEPADSRMQRHARMHGYNITHKSRKIKDFDFDDYDLIVAMDEDNLERLNDIAPTLEAQSKIVRMTDYCKIYSDDCVPDPYYGGEQGFEHVISLLEDACKGLFEETRRLN